MPPKCLHGYLLQAGRRSFTAQLGLVLWHDLYTNFTSLGRTAHMDAHSIQAFSSSSTSSNKDSGIALVSFKRRALWLQNLAIAIYGRSLTGAGDGCTRLLQRCTICQLPSSSPLYIKTAQCLSTARYPLGSGAVGSSDGGSWGGFPSLRGSNG